MAADNTAPADIFVVVSSRGGEGYSSGHDGPKNDGGPIVHETEIGPGSSIEKARERAAMMERRWGPCRIARLVFEDQQGNPL